MEKYLIPPLNSPTTCPNNLPTSKEIDRQQPSNIIKNQINSWTWPNRLNRISPTSRLAFKASENNSILKKDQEVVNQSRFKDSVNTVILRIVNLFLLPNRQQHHLLQSNQH